MTSPNTAQPTLLYNAMELARLQQVGEQAAFDQQLATVNDQLDEFAFNIDLSQVARESMGRALFKIVEVTVSEPVLATPEPAARTPRSKPIVIPTPAPGRATRTRAPHASEPKNELFLSNNGKVLRGDMNQPAEEAEVIWPKPSADEIPEGSFDDITEVENTVADGETGAQRAYRPDYNYARIVSVSELSRKTGNGDRETNKQYVQNQSDARQVLVDAFEDGSIYASQDSFEQTLKQAHRAAANDNVYAKVNAGRHLTERRQGDFRMGGVLINYRIEDALIAESIAVRYGDPYAARLKDGGPAQSTVKLAGIDERYYATDHWNGRSYRFEYPHSDGLSQYMERITALGQEIFNSLHSPAVDKVKLVELIAAQYQYGAIARPFDNINNSLFMSLANAQLKLAGLNPMTHGSLDLIAQRLQPKAFVAYFCDRAAGADSPYATAHVPQ